MAQFIDRSDCQCTTIHSVTTDQTCFIGMRSGERAESNKSQTFSIARKVRTMQALYSCKLSLENVKFYWAQIKVRNTRLNENRNVTFKVNEIKTAFKVPSRWPRSDRGVYPVTFYAITIGDEPVSQRQVHAHCVCSPQCTKHGCDHHDFINKIKFRLKTQYHIISVPLKALLFVTALRVAVHGCQTDNSFCCKSRRTIRADTCLQTTSFLDSGPCR